MTIQKKRSDKVYIDLTGPQGNVFFLIGQARVYAKQLGLDVEKITSEMMESDYENAIQVFDRYFGKFVVLER